MNNPTCLFSGVAVVAILRRHVPTDLVSCCRALHDGGILAVEITLPTPGSLSAITSLRRKVSGPQLIGAGTITSADDARSAIEAGAQFLVTPTLDTETVLVAKAAGIPICVGAYTPTEALTAYRLGATRVKIFPADDLEPSYIRNILAPLPFLPLMPTGHIRLENVPAWFEAGAVAVGVGPTLLPHELIDAENWTGLTAAARKWADTIAQLRPGSAHKLHP